MGYDAQLGTFVEIDQKSDCWWFDISGRELEQDKFKGEQKWFKCTEKLQSEAPLFCGHIRISTDRDKLKAIFRSERRGLKSFVPRSTLHDEFGMGSPADPESLDDSDLELLAGPTENLNISNLSDQGQGVRKDFHFVASRNAIRIVGSNVSYKLAFDMIDCQVVKNSPGSGFSDDVVIALATDGALYVIGFDAALSPIILHWMYMGHASYEPKFLRVHPEFGQFVVVYGSVIRFFRFTAAYIFELVSNLDFEESSVTDCSFLQNGNRPDHLMLFVTLARPGRVTLCVVQWGGAHEEKKEVRPINLLRNDPITAIVALEDTHCLIFTSKEMSLVTANQVLSGELPTTGPDRAQFGDQVWKCFDDPELLRRLKKIRPDFEDYVHCTVMATSNGALCCCVVDESRSTKYLALTRFKGLTKAFVLSNTNTSAGSYLVMISSFGRLFKLCLDLTSLQEITKDYKIAALQNVTSRKIMNAGYIVGESLMYISRSPRVMSKGLQEKDVLWQLSQATISMITPHKNNQSCSSVLTMKSLRVLDTLQVMDCDSLSSKWKKQLLSCESADPLRFLLMNKSPEGNSYLLLLEWNDGYNKAKVIELEDMVRKARGHSILYFFTEDNFVHVTTESVCVDNFEEDGSWIYETNWPLTGALNYESVFVGWNRESGKFLFCNDITTCSGAKFCDFTCPMNDQWSVITTVTIIKKLDGKLAILVICDGTLYQFDCENISTDYRPLVISADCGLYCGSSCENQALFSDINGDLYHSVIQSSGHLSIPKKADFGLDSNIPWNIRFINERSCIVFASKTMFLLDINDYTSTFIPVGMDKKHSTIVDLRHSGGLYFVLYSDGLQVLEPNCFTKTPSQVVTKATRIQGKKFLYLKEINRMLLVNCVKKSLDCIKLENGKLMSLDSKCLSDYVTILDVILIEIINGPISLIIAGALKDNKYSWAVKLVQIIPLPGKLVVREVSSKLMETKTPKNLKMRSSTSSSFWISSGAELWGFQLTASDMTLNYKTKALSHDIHSFDVTNDILVAVTKGHEVYVEYQGSDGLWYTLGTFPLQEAKSCYKIVIINHSSVAIYGESRSQSDVPFSAGISFYTLRNSSLECYNTITFAKPVQDVQYSKTNDELSVLHNDGSIETFQGQKDPYKIEEIIGKLPVIHSNNPSSQTGCFSMNGDELQETISPKT